MKYARFLSAALLISALSITALGIHAQDAAPVATAEAAAAAQPFTLINLNDTNSEALMAIPGMTDRMTDEFGEYAPYISILQFRQEIGKYVDEAQVAAYEQYIYVPVQANDSDAATLQQIPGVTADIADKLIAARPYADANAFVEALGQYLNPEQAAYGANYVEGYVKPFTLINLNATTEEELISIPNMTDRMIGEFEEYVPFVSILQFREEIGKYIDEADVAAYEQYIYVPVQANDSDAATLQQIPGVTADIADALIAARPYADANAFVEALGQYLTPAQVEYGANYVEGYIKPADASATAEPTVEAAAQAFTLLNLNNVTSDQLLTAIPDMSNRMTREFAEYVPYVSILQFRQEIGKYVGEDQVKVYEQYVYVPVQINDADSATLQQIPGVTADIADKLIAARPYADNAAFVTALGQYLTPDQAAYAANYLEAN